MAPRELASVVRRDGALAGGQDVEEADDALVRELVHRRYQDGWPGLVVACADLLDVDEEAGA